MKNLKQTYKDLNVFPKKFKTENGKVFTLFKVNRDGLTAQYHWASYEDPLWLTLSHILKNNYEIIE